MGKLQLTLAWSVYLLVASAGAQERIVGAQNRENDVRVSAPSRELREYSMGQAAATCLFRGCEVLLGSISSVGERREEPGGGPNGPYAAISRTIILEGVEGLY